MGPGDRVDRFEILERLGAGGMGVVVAARDVQLGRRVALKLVRADRDDAKRLLTEARAMARVRHPNVVTVYEATERDGELFIAMEEMRGGTMREHIEQHRHLDWRQIVSLYTQAGQGLAAAHAAGMVHRDFKPDNVFVGGDGRVCVGDFGLVGAQDRQGRFSSSTLGGPYSDVDSILGTPAYMAPEQHYGDPVDARSDQFAFCVSLWEALYGKLPFEGRTRDEYVSAMEDGRFRTTSRRRVPGWLRRVLMRGLSVDQGERYPSMEALLEEFADDEMRPVFRLRPAASFAAAAALWPLVGLFGPPRFSTVAAVIVVVIASFGVFAYAARESWTRNAYNRGLFAGLCYMLLALLLITAGMWIAQMPPILARVMPPLVLSVFFGILSLTMLPRAYIAALGFAGAFLLAAALPAAAPLVMTASIALCYASLVFPLGPDPAARRAREKAALRERSRPREPEGVRPTPGSKVGRFVVNSVLRSGRTGSVLSARDPRLERNVTLWFDAAISPDHDVAARLRHPNVLSVYEVGVHEGRGYRVTEHTRAITLAAWIDGTTAMSWEQAGEIFAQVARGLSAAHRAGITHGRFSFDHVYMEEAGRVVVGGFGASGSRADRQADILAFCSAVWMLITTKVSAPSWLFSVITRGLQADPAQRYQSMDELVRLMDPEESDYGAARGMWRIVFSAVLPGCAVAIAAISYWLGRYSHRELLIVESAVLLMMLGIGAGFRDRIDQTHINRVLHRVLLLAIAAAMVLCIGGMLGDISVRHTEVLTLGLFAVVIGSAATVYDPATYPGGIAFAAAFVASAIWPGVFPLALAAATCALGALSIELLARPRPRIIAWGLRPARRRPVREDPLERRPV